jgi:hypothetical protein
VHRPAALILCLIACGGPQPPPPQPAPLTYESMPEAFRRTYSQAEFARMMRGEAVVPEKAQWPAADPAPSPPGEMVPMGTPRETVQAFLLAYQQERWDLMVAFVPDHYRALMTADLLHDMFSKPETRATMEQIAAAAADGAIDQNGDRAHLHYGNGLDVELVQEGEVWKIEDLD